MVTSLIVSAGGSGCRGRPVVASGAGQCHQGVAHGYAHTDHQTSHQTATTVPPRHKGRQWSLSQTLCPDWSSSPVS